MPTRVEPYTSEELRIWRAKVRLTQSQMAKLFHTSQRSISHWEAGAVPKDFSERFEKVLAVYYNIKTK
jgi:DNA-binding transcriptional regulator YiaG